MGWEVQGQCAPEAHVCGGCPKGFSLIPEKTIRPVWFFIHHCFQKLCQNLGDEDKGVLHAQQPTWGEAESSGWSLPAPTIRALLVGPTEFTNSARGSNTAAGQTGILQGRPPCAWRGWHTGAHHLIRVLLNA